jgi:IS5 family transposase
MKDNPDASPDKDARYGYKSREKPFFGYKAHASIDYDSELITKLGTTPGNVNEFLKVVDSKSKMTTADKVCDSKKKHCLQLEENG